MCVSKYVWWHNKTSSNYMHDVYCKIRSVLFPFPFPWEYIFVYIQVLLMFYFAVYTSMVGLLHVNTMA